MDLGIQDQTHWVSEGIRWSESHRKMRYRMTTSGFLEQTGQVWGIIPPPLQKNKVLFSKKKNLKNILGCTLTGLSIEID